MKATGLLLQFIAANGGRIDRGALHETMRELIDQGLVEAEFKDAKKQPSDYSYVLTEGGKVYVRNAARVKGPKQPNIPRPGATEVVHPLHIEALGTKLCDKCQGTGLGEGLFLKEVICMTCSGSGIV